MLQSAKQRSTMKVAEEKAVPLFSFRSTRLWISLLLTLGLSCTVSMRLDLSMAIVCMVNSTAVNTHATETRWSNVTVDDSCPSYSNPSAVESAGYNGHLEWTPSMQALLLSTTYYGGLVTIMFSGYFADRCGPKLIFIGAVTVYVIVTLLTPFLAQTSYTAFFIARVIMGLGEGFVFPSGASVTGRWFSPHERSTVASFYTSGNQIAASLTSFISANLCASALGWQSIFYLFGCLGILWAIVWFIVFSNTPQENRWISEEEKHYLTMVVKQPTKENAVPIQWLKLATSVPLIVAVLCQFAYNFQAATFQAFLPTYFKEELKVSLQKNGVFSMIPFITQLVSKIVLSIVADHLKRKQYISHTMCSKTFQTISSFGCALTMFGLATLPDCNNVWIAGVLLGIFGIFFSCGIPGFFTSILSLDPRSSGLLSSIAMTLGMLGNICGPLALSVLDKIAEDNKWYILFMFNVILNVITGVLFCLYGSADAQPWSRAKRQCQQDAEKASHPPEEDSPSAPSQKY